MKLKCCILIAVLYTGVTCYAQDWKVYPYKPAGSLLSFPADEGRHTSEPVEWWYTSGHLTGSSGKTYNYMLTYFYYPALGYDGFRILNVTDEATGKFYQDSKVLKYDSLSTSNLHIRASVSTEGIETFTTKVDANNKLVPFEYLIHAASPFAALDLNCVSLKRPLILDDDGYLEQGASSYTYYYSQTSNEVSGKLSLNGVTDDVTGTAWIDRQFGNFNPFSGEKYEWFQMQLSNGMDVNLWNIFTQNNTIPSNDKYRLLSAYVNDTTQYTISDFKIERLGFTWMPDSLACYSNKWRFTSDSNKIDLTISAINNDNEVMWPFRFFEGATTIAGTINGKAVTGVGFAELLHNYHNPQLSVNAFAGDQYYTSLPITWQLLNADEGSPVTYDLEYSTDNKATFTPIVQGLTDTSYQWNTSSLSDGDKIWFKVTAHSVDDKLTGTVISLSYATVITGNSFRGKIKLFPNPVQGYLYIDPALKTGDGPCKIIDAKGQVIYIFEKNAVSNKIDVRFLPGGVYFLQINSGDNTTVLKFIKSK
jgi:predicted secreted hydrolase